MRNIQDDTYKKNLLYVLASVIAKHKIAQIWSTENNYSPNVIKYGNNILNVDVFATGTSKCAILH